MPFSDQRCERRDVELGLGRQLAARRKVLVIARRTCIVGGQETWRAIAGMHLAQVRCAGKDVVAWIIGIVTETMPDTQTSPRFRA